MLHISPPKSLNSSHVRPCQSPHGLRLAKDEKAHYYDVVVGRSGQRPRAWFYPEPQKRRPPRSKGRVAFLEGRFQVLR